MFAHLKKYLKFLRSKPVQEDRTLSQILGLPRNLREVSDEEVCRQIRSVPTHFGSNLVDLPDFYFKFRLAHYMWDDFDTYVDTQLWTKLAADAGATVTNVDNTNGWLTLTTAAVANNEAAVSSTRKNWKFLNNKPLIYEARINFAQANVNQAAIAFGFSSTFAADLLLDTTGLPAASFSGALIYTNPGETVWRCVTSLGTTQTIQKSTTTSGGTVDQTLKIEVRTVSSTLAEVTFYSNGTLLLDAAQTGRATPIKQTITYTGAAAMQFGAYAKSIDGTGEVVNLDYLFAGQLR